MTKTLDELFIEFKEGSEKAFELIYVKTNEKVFYTILSITKDYHLAEDLMQDTYIKIRQNINKYKPQNQAMKWLIMVSRNLAINEYNKRKRELCVDHNKSDFLYDTYNIDDNDTYNTIIKLLNTIERQIVIMHIITGLK